MSMRGDLSVDDASKLMTMLRVQGELLSAEALEKRLDSLEGEVKVTAGFKPEYSRLQRAA
jgi:hypothetical protein